MICSQLPCGLNVAAVVAWPVDAACPRHRRRRWRCPGASNSTPSLTAARVERLPQSGRRRRRRAPISTSRSATMAVRHFRRRGASTTSTATQARRTSSLRESCCPARAQPRTLTVVWSKRDPGPQQTRRDVIRMSRSTDGGRTFSPARFAHNPEFSGRARMGVADRWRRRRCARGVARRARRSAEDGRNGDAFRHGAQRTAAAGHLPRHDRARWPHHRDA